MSQENGKAEQTADLSYSNLSEPLTSSAGKMHESDASAENMPTLKPTFFAALSITDHGTVPKNRDFDAIEANAAPESFVKETSSTFAKMKNTLEVIGEVVSKHPITTICVPLLVMFLLIGLGVYGVLAGAASMAESNKSTAYSVVKDTSQSFTFYIEKAFAPLVTLNSFIQQTPNYKELLPKFPSIAAGLLASLPPNTFGSLQFSPFGFIMSDIPNLNSSGIDIFNSSVLRDDAVAMLSHKTIALTGPKLLAKGVLYGAPTRMPIFISNVSEYETFGNNVILPTNVTMDQVYNYSSRTKFWGFVTALILFDKVKSGADPIMTDLRSKGYLYSLSGGDGIIGITDPAPPIADAVSYTFAMTNQKWTLSIYPSSKNGWDSTAWKWPLVALVVIISVVIAFLVFVMNVSLKQQGWMLQKMVLTNKELAMTTHDLEDEKARLATTNKELAATTTDLQAEKARMDAMLVRQYNLIQCFSNPKATGHDLDKDDSAVDRIENMRTQLNNTNVKNLAETEQIKTLEVLGEGSFGKVYKGLWRGTEVAIKTMMLAANMSGTEKREKMAVMEAAISSSLAHPNVVATYTYSIKPVRDTTSSKAAVDAGIIVLSGSISNTSFQAGSESESGTPRASGEFALALVHSYEVRLVLEYCDLGSLREALDQGAFLGNGVLNYHAILDTALDVAKAMCHLHAMNVLHSDLKASNVMLKSSGDRRGFVAKVSDFGLSVKMDHMETHLSNVYQGTMTHMAPEILLEGRVSKAVDVYAFGITLWELFTGGKAFSGTPYALLGHAITREHKRPAFTRATPEAFRGLAEMCWDPDHEKRPAFDDILSVLTKMRAALNGRTMKMNVEAPKPGRTGAGKKENNVPGSADGFDTGAQGVSTLLPGSEGMAALSRFRFPPPLEAVEEGEEEKCHSTDAVDQVPSGPAPAEAIIDREPSAGDEGKEDAE